MAMQSKDIQRLYFLLSKVKRIKAYKDVAWVIPYQNPMSPTVAVFPLRTACVPPRAKPLGYRHLAMPSAPVVP